MANSHLYVVRFNCHRYIKSRYSGLGRILNRSTAALALILAITAMAITSSAQLVQLTPQQLDQLVERIALYQDPLLAQVLTASTYWDEVPDAAGWADRYSYLWAMPWFRQSRKTTSNGIRVFSLYCHFLPSWT